MRQHILLGQLALTWLHSSADAACLSADFSWRAWVGAASRGIGSLHGQRGTSTVHPRSSTLDLAEYVRKVRAAVGQLPADAVCALAAQLLRMASVCSDTSCVQEALDALAAVVRGEYAQAAASAAAMAAASPEEHASPRPALPAPLRAKSARKTHRQSQGAFLAAAATAAQESSKCTGALAILCLRAGVPEAPIKR